MRKPENTQCLINFITHAWLRAMGGDLFLFGRCLHVSCRDNVGNNAHVTTPRLAQRIDDPTLRFRERSRNDTPPLNFKRNFSLSLSLFLSFVTSCCFAFLPFPFFNWA
jgi:hypothetical protein